MEDDEEILRTHVQPRLRHLVLPQQQAIEDLQSEEEKVNLLTKQNTKLQMQAEEVSTSLVYLLFRNMKHAFFYLSLKSIKVTLLY